MISGLLRNMDPVLEDAGAVLGAARWRVVRRITLPLLSPGLLSVFIFLGMAMVQAFDLPLIVGMTARVPVLSTRIFMASSPDSGVPDYGIAAAFGVVLLLLAMLLMWGYFRVVRFGERYRVVSGKGFRPKRAKLTRGTKAAALAAVGTYFALMLLPLLILLWVSLLPFYQQPSLAALRVASLAAYVDILAEPQVQRAIGNTILLFLGSATIVMAMASLISWFSVRDRGPVGRWLDILSFAPIAVPPIVLATALLLVFLGTPLYGTIWVLLIGHVTVYLAFGTRTMNGALIQIDRELENAALISGASWSTSLRRIVLPLVWPHLLNGWLWVVAHSARDLTFGLILLTSSNIVASTSIYLMWDQPDLPGAAALSVLLVAGMMLLVVPIQIHASRGIDARF
jgi:iron(III) transport system permease protein